jgi:hypothetical protein
LIIPSLLVILVIELYNKFQISIDNRNLKNNLVIAISFTYQDLTNDLASPLDISSGTMKFDLVWFGLKKIDGKILKKDKKRQG